MKVYAVYSSDKDSGSYIEGECLYFWKEKANSVIEVLEKEKEAYYASKSLFKNRFFPDYWYIQEFEINNDVI